MIENNHQHYLDEKRQERREEAYRELQRHRLDNHPDCNDPNHPGCPACTDDGEEACK